jgi:hypothetical protein
LNPQYRYPTPGSNDPTLYDDPVTVPAGDIAENPYWKRDVRRSYPKLSVVRQPDVVALLSVGSAAQPNDKLQIGEAGKNQLVALKEEGEKGLSAFFEKEKGMAKGVLGPNGMPPLPARYGTTQAEPLYNLKASDEQTYGPKYVYPRGFGEELLLILLPATLAELSCRWWKIPGVQDVHRLSSN